MHPTHYAVACTVYAPSSEGWRLETKLDVIRAESPEDAAAFFMAKTRAAVARGETHQFTTPVAVPISPAP